MTDYDDCYGPTTIWSERPRRYILVGHETRPAAAGLTDWASHCGRRVGDTTIGDVRVSTVFLGLDHNYGRSGPPILFETMIFGGEHDGEQWRYSTWDEAEKGHSDYVAAVTRAIQERPRRVTTPKPNTVILNPQREIEVED